MKKRYVLKIGRFAAIAVALFLAYLICFGALPYAREKTVDAEFADSVSPDEFYGDGVCADRVALAETPEQGFDLRIHMLDEAKETIDISYYEISMGTTSDQFLGRICAFSFIESETCKNVLLAI